MSQRINAYGRHLLIHGVNMSLGYDFEPKWFACGQSPLCVEVNRLVKSGVVVVVAAGNTGYGQVKASEGIWAAGLGLTINDPGNAELAITVGSTHRDMPHRYGGLLLLLQRPDWRRSSQAGPGSARRKDCLLRSRRLRPIKPVRSIVNIVVQAWPLLMSAAPLPHFFPFATSTLVKREKVKDIFVKSATDLHREKYFQGAGLIDLMRAVQSV